MLNIPIPAVAGAVGIGDCFRSSSAVLEGCSAFQYVVSTTRRGRNTAGEARPRGSWHEVVTARKVRLQHKRCIALNQHANLYGGVVAKVNGMDSAHPLTTEAGLLGASSASSSSWSRRCSPSSHGSSLSRCEQQWRQARPHR